MRLDAHPLVLAVALGLLGPAALSDEEDAPLHELRPAGTPDGRCAEALDTCLDGGVGLEADPGTSPA